MHKMNPYPFRETTKNVMAKIVPAQNRPSAKPAQNTQAVAEKLCAAARMIFAR